VFEDGAKLSIGARPKHALRDAPSGSKVSFTVTYGMAPHVFSRRRTICETIELGRLSFPD